MQFLASPVHARHDTPTECWTSGYVTWRIQLGKQQADVEAENAPVQLRDALKCLASFGSAFSGAREETCNELSHLNCGRAHI